MLDTFEVAAGSVIGREHVLAGRNNQDAWALSRSTDALLAVVCDGCGSARASEVGATLGARMVVEALHREAPRLATEPVAPVIESVRLRLLTHLQRLADALGEPRAAVVSEHLLFTVVAAVLTQTMTYVFTLGDGAVAVNGASRLLACQDNAPPYLAYELLRPAGANGQSALHGFSVQNALPTAAVSSLLIGTDGVKDLLITGPLDWLWGDDRFFDNPAALTRRLRQLNRTPQRIDWERRRVERETARLPDDTTLVVIRRKAAAP
jgi:hypothetical protein